MFFHVSTQLFLILIKTELCLKIDFVHDYDYAYAYFKSKKLENAYFSILEANENKIRNSRFAESLDENDQRKDEIKEHVFFCGKKRKEIGLIILIIDWMKKRYFEGVLKKWRLHVFLKKYRNLQ